MSRPMLIIALLALVALGCEDPTAPEPGTPGPAAEGTPAEALPDAPETDAGVADEAGETVAGDPTGGDAGTGTDLPATPALPTPSAAIPANRSAWDLAAKKKLPKVEVGAYPGIENVIRLGENIISGGEPHGEAALKAIADMGVKTILSVDGKTPDVEAAKKLGMRYVHVPIRYLGITDSERLRITKVFRELEGPFYVHCFHGVHRGPAAAAWGRVVLDGVPRQQALSEMRQWCGTSDKYRGLYRDVGKAKAPTDAELAAFEWGFPARHEFKGYRHAMVELSRSFEHLKSLKQGNWKVDPEHPDLSPLNEAKKLSEAFEGAGKLPEVAKRPADFRRWNEKSVEWSGKLVNRLERVAAGEKKARSGADEAFREVRQRCDSCHAGYRNRSK